MKKLVTERDLEDLGQGATFRVTPEMILTPSARDFASRNGIQLSWGDAAAPSNDSAMDRAIRDIVTAELGSADANVIQAVRSAMSDTPQHDSPASKAMQRAVEAKEGRHRAVLSAMGENRRGILAAITSAVSELGGNVQDVSQTIVGGYFSVILIVDLEDLVHTDFDAFRTKVLEVVNGLGLEGMLMHEDILRAMHRV